MSLSDKEVQLLEDKLEHENLCITKYNFYIDQIVDIELVTLFKSIVTQEQEHANIINELLRLAERSGTIDNPKIIR